LMPDYRETHVAVGPNGSLWDLDLANSWVDNAIRSGIPLYGLYVGEIDTEMDQVVDWVSSIRDTDPLTFGFAQVMRRGRIGLH
jgi:hypothetical protein